MITITLANKLENQQLTHAGGPLEVGRGPKRGNVARVMVLDGFVSRDHLRIEEMDDAQVRVDNLSVRAPIAIDSHSLLTPGTGYVYPLPIRLGIGETIIDIDYVQPEEPENMFLTVSAPIRDATISFPSLLAMGDSPPVDQLVSWLEPAVTLHRATDPKDLFTKTAQALVERIGLDTGAVLVKDGEVWRTVAYSSSDQRIANRPISHMLLRQVEAEKRTFYLPAAAVGHGESLVGVQSVVASPVLNDRGDAVGIVCGTRSVQSRKREIGKLEAHVVQLLASAVGVGLDRFERDAEANQLRVAKESAEQADRTKSQFLAMVSHELRTPLTTILGYSEMLQEQAEADDLPQYKDDLKQVHTAANHLLALINDILDLSKIEAGKMELAREPFDPAAVIRDLMVSIEPIARKNNNKLEIDVPKDLGPGMGDATRLRQCVLNLVGNACKFTKDGTVSVTARRELQDGHDYLNIAVRDTGIGMSPDQLDRLFQPFTQVDSSAGRKHGGTGLGLAISQKLCQAMMGSIIVESALGSGSTFTMTVRSVMPKS